MAELSKIRWRCRRGMKELDILLEEYLETRFNTASPLDQRAFSALLDLPDPVLLAYITGRETPETEEQRCVIESLRRTA